jgi:hypothetical protein
MSYFSERTSPLDEWRESLTDGEDYLSDPSLEDGDEYEEWMQCIHGGTDELTQVDLHPERLERDRWDDQFENARGGQLLQNTRYLRLKMRHRR